MAPRPHVLIATPCFGAMVHQGYMLSVLGLLAGGTGGAFDVSLALLGHDSLITRSRNTLLARFLATPGATHILFIDADRELVAGIYPLKVSRWDHAARERMLRGESLAAAPLLYVGTACEGAEAERDGAFVTGSYAGSGFMLARRDMVERMAAAYPETRYRHIGADTPGMPDGAMCHALFDCSIDPVTGTYLSEDFTFCRRWRAIGGKLWLDTAGRLVHTGAHDYAGDPAPRYAAADRAVLRHDAAA